jgi:hypothetical protein
MRIYIKCSEVDCTFNSGGWTGHDHSWENKCTHPAPCLKNHPGNVTTCISKDKRAIQTDEPVINLAEYAKLEKQFGTPFDEEETKGK